jgi:glycosyltransferase involved in cell wall biosynthesis
MSDQTFESQKASPETHGSLRILMLVRKNLREHPGGDTTQILQTAAHLHRLGLNIDLQNTLPSDLSAYDVVHLFHLDRLWENLAHVRCIQKTGVPCVLSTIYWPPDEYDRHARTGFQGSLARMLGSRIYENLRLIQRWALQSVKREQALVFCPNFIDGAFELLESVDVILPNSRAEQQQIEDRFGRYAECVVVPNGVDVEVFRPPGDDDNLQRVGVLCVGRFEPRKNQLNLVRALRGTEIPLTFVGQPGRFSKRYYRRCRRKATSNIYFAGQQPADVLSRWYHRFAVHACVSWYETPGLASLEAGLSGCNLVVTPGGCTQEYFGDGAFYCEPGNPDSIRKTIEKALHAEQSLQTPRHIMQNYTWDQVAEKTLEGYEQAIALRKAQTRPHDNTQS